LPSVPLTERELRALARPLRAGEREATAPRCALSSGRAPAWPQVPGPEPAGGARPRGGKAAPGLTRPPGLVGQNWAGCRRRARRGLWSAVCLLPAPLFVRLPLICVFPRLWRCWVVGEAALKITPKAGYFSKSLLPFLSFFSLPSVADVFF